MSVTNAHGRLTPLALVAELDEAQVVVFPKTAAATVVADLLSVAVCESGEAMPMCGGNGPAWRYKEAFAAAADDSVTTDEDKASPAAAVVVCVTASPQFVGPSEIGEEW